MLSKLPPKVEASFCTTLTILKTIVKSQRITATNSRGITDRIAFIILPSPELFLDSCVINLQPASKITKKLLSLRED